MDNTSNIKNTTDLFLRKTQTVSIDGRGITGLSSGIEELDRITHGFQEGDLITVAGRPAIGKSSLALSMVKRIAIDHRMPVIYISPSMTGEKIVKRLLSIVCRIPLEHIVSGMLSVEEWENLERGSAALRDSPIYIFDTPGICIDKLEEQVHMFCKQNKAKAVFIDYLQLIQSKGNTNWTRNDEVTDVVCRLKSLAMTLNVPFIILSQTNRPEHKEATDSIYTPKLSDLRDSGTIEDVSDIVMFIHCPEFYQVYQDEYGNDLRGITELYIEKNLTGHRHRIRLKSNYDIASFESVQTQHLSFDSGQASPFGIF